MSIKIAFSTEEKKQYFFRRANGNWLCDGGFYAVQSLKTAIAKPVL